MILPGEKLPTLYLLSIIYFLWKKTKQTPDNLASNYGSLYASSPARIYNPL